jgi:hypothetical protein
MHEQTACEACIENDGTSCAVAEGREAIEHCEGFLEHRLRLPQLRHPYTESEWMAIHLCRIEEEDD